MSDSFSMDEAVYLIMEQFEGLENHNVYFAMREWGLTRIKTVTVEYVKAFIAIDNLGLPVTTRLVQLVLGKTSVNSVVQTLHTFGDKNILVLTGSAGGQGNPLMWVLNQDFKKSVRTG